MKFKIHNNRISLDSYKSSAQLNLNKEEQRSSAVTDRCRSYIFKTLYLYNVSTKTTLPKDTDKCQYPQFLTFSIIYLLLFLSFALHGYVPG